MAGSGFIKQMSDTIRNNRSHLRKKSMFKKEKSFFEIRKEYLKSSQGVLESKKLSKAELKRIREKIVNQRRNENLRNWLIIALIFIPLIYIGIKAYVNHTDNIMMQTQTIKENYLAQNLNEFNYLIDDGDRWVEKRNWNNAIYRYKQALKIFPDDFNANYRLALVYSYSCKFQNKYCEAGSKLTNRLHKYFPEKEVINKLKNNFNNINKK